MSRRCGMLLFQLADRHPDIVLLERLGFMHPTAVELPKGMSQVMAKADDFIVSIAVLGNGWTSIWGQYDFNVLPDVSGRPFVARLPEANSLIYYAVEGTSGALVFEHFEKGELIRSYAEAEGDIEAPRCFGDAPPRDKEFGQVDEWELLVFALPSGVTYDQISGAKYVHYRFVTTPPAPAGGRDVAEVNKPWWRIW